MRFLSGSLVFARDSKASHEIAAFFVRKSIEWRSSLSSSFSKASKPCNLLWRYSKFRTARRSNRRNMVDVLFLSCTMKSATDAKPFGYSTWAIRSSTSGSDFGCRRNMDMIVVVRVGQHRPQSINDRSYKALAVYFTGSLSQATVQLMKPLKIPYLRRSLILTVVIPW